MPQRLPKLAPEQQARVDQFGAQMRIVDICKQAGAPAKEIAAFVKANPKASARQARQWATNRAIAAAIDRKVKEVYPSGMK